MSATGIKRTLATIHRMMKMVQKPYIFADFFQNFAQKRTFTGAIVPKSISHLSKIWHKKNWLTGFGSSFLKEFIS
jgi:hypothetical protein